MINFSYNTKVKSHEEYDGKCAFISFGMKVFYNYGLESFCIAESDSAVYQSVDFMKKLMVGLIFVLLSVFLMPTTAFAASDYSVDKVSFTAELRKDGSALITEEWTVTFHDESEGFRREIMIPQDDFEFFKDIRDVSVSVDGNGCSEVMADSVVNGTYSLEKTEDRYAIRWFMLSKNETRTFSLRYLQTGAVKLYNDRAYFYCTVANEESNLLCRNVTVTVKTPSECYAEDFSIVESGSLAGKKSDNQVVFFATNAMGLIRTGLSVPSSLFDSSSLAVIVDDNRAEIVAVVITCVVCAAVAAFGVFYILNYRKLFRNYWEKKCRKKAHSESSYEAQYGILSKLSPARIINIVSGRTVSGADIFILTFLDLMERGYIKASAEGFDVSEKSDTDTLERPIDKNERMVLDFFSTEKWQKTVAKPKKFYVIAERFNKKIPFVTPFFVFTPEGKKIIRRCFELKLAAKRHEFVLPEEISDDIFKGGKYTALDLVISLLNEYVLSESYDFERPDAERFKRNMFILRETYEEGKKIAEKEEAEKMRQKKLKKKKAVTDDDIYSQ